MEKSNVWLGWLNISKQCREHKVNIWQCPQFLFVVMGAVIILSIIITNIVAKKFISQEIIALIVLSEAAILFIIGHVIVSSFEKVADASRAKSEFISIVSHRLRDPLSSIKWLSDILESEEKNLSELEIKQSMEAINSQNEKMIRIINDLLILSNIEEKNIILNPKSFSLKEAVEEEVKLQKEKPDSSDLHISVLTPGTTSNVFADKIKIKTVIFHLLDNAIRYSLSDLKSLSVSITLKEGSQDFVHCEISDTGIGIPEKDTSKIFTKFFRSDISKYHQTEGTGIGLFVSKSIIEASGGKVGFSSIEGKGSTFWFTLPVTK